MLRVLSRRWLALTVQNLVHEQPPLKLILCKRPFGTVQANEIQPDPRRVLPDRRGRKDPSIPPHTTKKHKVAFYVGYVGTGFRGLQSNPDRDDALEDTIVTAMHAAGYVLDSNFVPPFYRIGLFRSSRTDKGVHACGVIITCKAELPADNIEGELAIMASKVQAHLPSTIRVWGFQRVRKSFNPRWQCMLREYRYLMPTSILSASHVPDEVWMPLVPLLQGQHYFHNLSGRLERSPRPLKPRVDFTPNPDALCERDQEAFKWSKKFDTRYIRRLVNASVRRTKVSHPEKGLMEVFEFSFAGESFLFHQIRYMVGLCLLVAEGVIAPSLMPVVVDGPYKFRLPLAPPTGLFLDFTAPDRALSLDDRIGAIDLNMSPQDCKSIQNFRDSVVIPHIVEELDGEDFRQYVQDYERRKQEGNFLVSDTDLVLAKFQKWQASKIRVETERRIYFERQKEKNASREHAESQTRPRQKQKFIRNGLPGRKELGVATEDCQPARLDTVDTGAKRSSWEE
eukprot:g37334.t1